MLSEYVRTVIAVFFCFSLTFSHTLHRLCTYHRLTITQSPRRVLRAVKAKPSTLTDSQLSLPPSENHGARRGNRTPDISLTKRVHYQLCYSGIFRKEVGGKFLLCLAATDNTQCLAARFNYEKDFGCGGWIRTTE